MISLELADVRAEVVPERGALVTRLTVGSHEVLYLDRETLDHPEKNVRGGIPLLFPFAGKLENDTFALTGTTIKQHGFGRNLAWSVTDHGASNLRMTLHSSELTRAQYPYEFTAHHEVRLLPRGLELALTLVAHGEALPVAPGWHPYFNISRADKSRVQGDGVRPEQFGDEVEFNFGITAPVEGRSAFSVPKLLIEASPDMRFLQFWSEAHKPFICIEPFFGRMGIINTDERGWVLAEQARTFWMRISLPE